MIITAGVCVQCITINMLLHPVIYSSHQQLFSSQNNFNFDNSDTSPANLSYIMIPPLHHPLSDHMDEAWSSN